MGLTVTVEQTYPPTAEVQRILKHSPTPLTLQEIHAHDSLFLSKEALRAIIDNLADSNIIRAVQTDGRRTFAYNQYHGTKYIHSTTTIHVHG